MTTSKIRFQGKEYNSIEELPPEAKQTFEKLTKILDDQDQNGIPDYFEGKADFIAVLKNVFHSKTPNTTSITKTEINIEKPQTIDVFTSESSPYTNPLHEKIATSSAQSTILFFLGVFLTALVMGAIFLFFLK